MQNPGLSAGAGCCICALCVSQYSVLSTQYSALFSRARPPRIDHRKQIVDVDDVVVVDVRGAWRGAGDRAAGGVVALVGSALRGAGGLGEPAGAGSADAAGAGGG